MSFFCIKYVVFFCKSSTSQYNTIVQSIYIKMNNRWRLLPGFLYFHKPENQEAEFKAALTDFNNI